MSVNVGLIVQLQGNWGDAIKLTMPSWVHRLNFGDEALHGRQTPHIQPAPV